MNSKLEKKAAVPIETRTVGEKGGNAVCLTHHFVATLKRKQLEMYIRGRFGPTGKLLTFGPIGKETSASSVKGYGYGSPIRLGRDRA